MAAGLLAAGYTETARGYAANETLSVACIGTGGRCRKLMESLASRLEPWMRRKKWDLLVQGKGKPRHQQCIGNEFGRGLRRNRDVPNARHRGLAK